MCTCTPESQLTIIILAGAIALTGVHNEFREAELLTLIGNVNCHGNENNLLDCSFNNVSSDSCGPLDDVGVICQGMLNCVSYAWSSILSTAVYSTNYVLYMYLSVPYVCSIVVISYALQETALKEEVANILIILALLQ